MNKNYELYYTTMDQDQVEEFTYNFSYEIINKYVKEHQEEFKKWKDFEHLKNVVKNGLDVNKIISFNERKQLLHKLGVNLNNEQ